MCFKLIFSKCQDLKKKPKQTTAPSPALCCLRPFPSPKILIYSAMAGGVLGYGQLEFYLQEAQERDTV